MRVWPALVVIVLGICFPFCGYAAMPAAASASSPVSNEGGAGQQPASDDLASAKAEKVKKESGEEEEVEAQEEDKENQVAAADQKTKAEELADAFKKSVGKETQETFTENGKKVTKGLSCVQAAKDIIRDSIDPDFPNTDDTINAAKYMLDHPEKYELTGTSANMSREQLLDAIQNKSNLGAATTAKDLIAAIDAAPEGTIIDLMRSPYKEETGQGSWGHFGVVTKVKDDAGNVKTMIISNQKVPGTNTYQMTYSDTPAQWVKNRAVPRGILGRNLLFQPK